MNKTTVEEVLEELEKMGFKCVFEDEGNLILEEEIKQPFYEKFVKRIHVFKIWKMYQVIKISKIKGMKIIETPEYINFKVHQLLNKLFIAWGWNNE